MNWIDIIAAILRVSATAVDLFSRPVEGPLDAPLSEKSEADQLLDKAPGADKAAP